MEGHRQAIEVGLGLIDVHELYHLLEPSSPKQDRLRVVRAKDFPRFDGWSDRWRFPCERPRLGDFVVPVGHRENRVIRFVMFMTS